ncbi:hypothetical protein [Actinacidiphila oryziradicis]|uniref:Integral membrane protein n=1 Tax=Actinacidiphila oryziradicis TaxID=2571141 RepID=A0A4U0SN27_9ACTN|nr:hypothetical protein [Actinacidiphila oryziradicis]MCW2870565.1 conserved rane protein of unknown function [Actinacidiphila oryziradicis]TKA10603.1 hypothetical protein FCI23_16655 [Actinacidiphila oryziradicis]
MLWHALAFAALGLAVASAVMRLLPATRLPSRRLVLPTGPVAALTGGLLARAILGPGHLLLTLLAAVAVAAALLSLLIRPSGRRESAPHPA